MKNKIEFIAFDADDTLWENELYFQELEHKFCHLLRKYSPAPISRKTKCSTFAKHFVPKSHLLTQFKM